MATKRKKSLYMALCSFIFFIDNLVLIAILVTVFSALSATTAFLVLKKVKRYSIIALNFIEIGCIYFVGWFFE